MKEHLMPLSLCPSCGKELDASSEFGGAGKPKPNDLSICLYCGAFLVFNENMTLRMLEPEELAALPHDLRNTMIEVRGRISAYYEGIADHKDGPSGRA